MVDRSIGGTGALNDLSPFDRVPGRRPAAIRPFGTILTAPPPPVYGGGVPGGSEIRKRMKFTIFFGENGTKKIGRKRFCTFVFSSAVETLTSGTIRGRFFHMYPRRRVYLMAWLLYWMKMGCIPLLCMNLQRGVPSTHIVPDAW